MGNLQPINASASPETQMTENFDAVENAAVYAKYPPTTSALTWGYTGGRWGGFSVAAGTLSLTNAADNYVVVARATGVISVTTAATNWNNKLDYARVYKLTTSGSVVTVIEDHRAGPHGVAGMFNGRHVNTTGVGNVGTGEDDLMTYSMPGTTFAEATKGVKITAWGITANNANAKTVKLLFGSATILTTALTVSQAGFWRIHANVISTGTDTQDYSAMLLQGGTTTLVDVEGGTATQDDGAAITIKCTGTATSNNDIVHEGLLIELIN